MRKAILIITLSLVSGLQLQASPIAFGRPAHPQKIKLFSLSDVRILGGPFKQVMDLDHKYLLSLSADRLLSLYRKAAGLRPKAPPYPSWESQDVWGEGPLYGHTLGFYLSGLSMMYQATGDTALLSRINYTLDQMNDCQQANKNGYLLAYPDGQQIFKDVAAGHFSTAPASINNRWEPVYVMNKVMLGLYRAYVACNSPLAKTMLVKMADYFGHDVLDHLSHDQIQKLLICEQGSINESFADVYQITGKEKYLKWAEELNDDKMLIPLSEGEDILNGWHANTQISKFTGFEKVYDYTGKEDYTQAARYFWDRVANHRSWVNGGNSVNEHFFPVDKFYPSILAGAGPESCNSIHMMRLTEDLYCDYGDPAKIGYYERVLFNHILANYDPETGTCVYYTSMRPGGYKVYGVPFKTFWCCSGTGLFAPAKFGKMIYAHDSSSLYVNLFIASKVTWQQKGLTLIQQTQFPDKFETKLKVLVKHPVKLTLKIRHPDWLTSPELPISINGKALAVHSVSDAYAEITRVWHSGDVITAKLPAKAQVAMLPGSDNDVSFSYGPIALATKVDNHGLTKQDFYSASNVAAPVKILPVSIAPFLTGDITTIANRIKRKQDSSLTFTIMADDNNKPVTLVPFYKIHFSRYAVYFPHFDSKEAYERHKLQEHQVTAFHEDLKKATVDSVAIGVASSENAHAMKTSNSHSGTGYGKHWRDASNEGYFQYKMKVKPGISQSLYVAFAGDDSGNRVFDITINGQVLKEIDHRQNKEEYAGKLYAMLIPIPAEMLNGQNEITVRFQAKPHNIAGGVFGLRVINDDYLSKLSHPPLITEAL